MQYHLRPEDRIPERCSVDPCPLGPDTTHYASREEAFAAYHEAEDGAAPTAQSTEAQVSSLPRGFIAEDGSVTLEPGTYWLGDPAYSVGQLGTAWDRWVDISAAASRGFQDPMSGASVNGWPVAAASTLYGDGLYPASNGLSYPVDSGCIGVTPKGLIEELSLDLEKLDSLGSWVSLADETKFSVAGEGTIALGDILIPTKE